MAQAFMRPGRQTSRGPLVAARQTIDIGGEVLEADGTPGHVVYPRTIYTDLNG
jgi:hypothetical protein